MATDPLSENVDAPSSSTSSKSKPCSPLLYLPDSVPEEFKDASFLEGIKAAKQTLGAVETGLSAKSEFELYFQTGPPTIDYKTLQKRAQNVDIRYSKIRSVYWKVFLSLLDNDTSQWIQQLKQKRDEYDKLKDKYINDAMKEDDDANNLIMDNPLLSTQGGKWDNFYKDTELRDTVVLDIDRTYPEDEFFINKIVQNSLTDILFIYAKENEWISYKQGMNEIIATLFMVNTVQSTISPYVDDDSKIPMDEPSDNQKEEEPDDNDKDETNTNEENINNDDNNTEQEQTEANGNENNEDSTPTKKDDDEKKEDTDDENKKRMTLWETVQDIRYIEHDTYFMFSEIMSIMGQYFINAEAKEVPPVVERSKRIQGQFLRQMDTQLAQHLLKINLTPQLYGLRWIRLFFSREFHLRDVCVVWDAIFGAYSERVQQTLKEHPKKENDDIVDPVKAIDNAIEKRKIKLDFRFVDYMSCSMLLFIRHQLIGRDISHCLRRVMRYPPVEDIASLVERAYTIRDQIERRGKKPKGKIASISGNLNIADRWNQFSRTVTSAMTTYAEDVKNLMGGQRRTLKSRMQFEYVLGTKMGQVLNSVQQTINKHRHDLDAAFLAQQSQSNMDTSSIQEIKSATTDNGDNKEESNNENDKNDTEISDDPLVKDKEDTNLETEKVIDDPLSAPPIDDPLGAMNGNKPEQDDQNKNEDDNKNVVIEEEKKQENPLMIIEEALAELKLVKDALLGNLDETQLESWLDWQFVEPSPEPSAASIKRRGKPPPPSASNIHKRNLSSSGLPPPKKGIRNSPQPKFSKSTSALKQHPLD